MVGRRSVASSCGSPPHRRAERHGPGRYKDSEEAQAALGLRHTPGPTVSTGGSARRRESGARVPAGAASSRLPAGVY
ncbi:unnamed protein product [Caretta caretta]